MHLEALLLENIDSNPAPATKAIDRNMLTELEDRVLAMSEGEWIDLKTGAAILESWFARRIDRQELASAIDRLTGSNLLQAKAQGKFLADTLIVVDGALESLVIGNTCHRFRRGLSGESPVRLQRK